MVQKLVAGWWRGPHHRRYHLGPATTSRAAETRWAELRAYSSLHTSRWAVAAPAEAEATAAVAFTGWGTSQGGGKAPLLLPSGLPHQEGAFSPRPRVLWALDLLVGPQGHLRFVGPSLAVLVLDATLCFSLLLYFALIQV